MRGDRGKRHPWSLARRITLVVSVTIGALFAVSAWLVSRSIDDHFELLDFDELQVVAESLRQALGSAQGRDIPDGHRHDPDGTIGIVRGGNSDGVAVGGTYLFQMSTGAQIGISAGIAPRYDYGAAPTYSFDTDSVVVTDRHAVTLSLAADVVSTQAMTRVTIWDLHPGAGAPAVILETGSGSRSDLFGAPHDVAITPDGVHAVVRSEEALGVWTLSGGTATRIFSGALTDNPGPFLDTAMDSVEVT